MPAILGLSAFYHDSAAALLVDGRIVAAAQEERFSRRKHDARFPAQAIRYCLREGDLKPRQLDAVVFYDKPLAKLDRLLETYVAFAPRGFRSFAAAMPSWLRQKLYLPGIIRKGLGGRYPLFFTEHHEAHAASAFFPSPFQEAAILTLDGVGEWATACYGVGRGNHIDLWEELRFPHSLGLLYAAFTAYAGFRVNSGEYKLMGLAPYGEPVYKDLILERLLDLKADGSFRLNQDYFRYCQGLTMTSRRFHRLFGGPPRRPESLLRQRDMDLAASIQVVTEEIVLRMARHVQERTGRRRSSSLPGALLSTVRPMAGSCAKVHFARSGSSRQRAMQGGLSALPGLPGITCSAGHVRSNRKISSKDRSLALPIRIPKWRRTCAAWRPSAADSSERTICSMPSPSSWQRAKRSAGFTGEWSSALARSGRAAFSPTCATLRCMPGSIRKSSSGNRFDRLPRVCFASRRMSTSTYHAGHRVLICCSRSL